MDAKIDKSSSSTDHHRGPRFVDVATSALGHLVEHGVDQVDLSHDVVDQDPIPIPHSSLDYLLVHLDVDDDHDLSLDEVDL